MARRRHLAGEVSVDREEWMGLRDNTGPILVVS